MEQTSMVQALGIERQAALRVKAERERRGWSLREVAARLQDVGCPIDAVGVQRIEQENRRVRVDEAVGFALVFELKIEDLFSSARAKDDEQFARDLQNGPSAYREMVGSASRYEGIVDRVAALAEAEPTRRAVVVDLLRMARKKYGDPEDSTTILFFSEVLDRIDGAVPAGQREGGE